MVAFLYPKPTAAAAACLVSAGRRLIRHDACLRTIESKSSSTYKSTVKLSNVTSQSVAFKFKTNAPARYSVKPVLGKVPPKETVIVFGASLSIPPGLRCTGSLTQSLMHFSPMRGAAAGT